jgi:hypothetical protein
MNNENEFIGLQSQILTLAFRRVLYKLEICDLVSWSSCGVR